MVKDKEYFVDIRKKIIKGMELAFEKLVIEKAKNDEELVFSEGGKIIFVKAKDLLKKKLKIGYKMEKSENSKEVNKLYLQVCQLIKKNGNDNAVPSKESFILKYAAFKELVEGHKLLLTAIGKL